MAGRVKRKTKQTLQERAHDVLRLSKVVIENSPIMLFRFRVETGWPVEFISRNIAQFGYSDEELLLGKVTYVSLIHPDDRDRVSLQVKEFGGRGIDHFLQEYRIITKKGEARWVEHRCTAERDADERITHYQGILIDITERKRAEEQVEYNTQRIKVLRDITLAITSTLDLRTVLDVLMKKIDNLLPYPVVFLWLINRESGVLDRFASWNLGEGEKEWKGMKMENIPPLTRQVIETKAPLAVRNVQSDPRVLNASFLRKHGLISYLGIPLIAKGEPLGCFCFMTREECQFSNEEVEFLSTLAAQAAIAIHNSQIYEQTRKQSQELAKLNVELEKSNKVKDEFLSVMSHELRTPLNVVMGYAGMMKDGLLGEVNPEQGKALEKILSRAGDQINLIESILQATQIEIGTMKVESQEVNLGKFLDDLRFSCETPLGKEISLYWNFPANLPVVETDTAKLRQILRNLFNNAVKFTEKGRVVISARHLPEARAVHFKVEDTGIGIPEDALPFIFDKFHQVDSSETRLYGGVGMGLYIVKMFTELLGGKVEVESRLGEGSTFTVIVPYEKTMQIRSYVLFQHADLHGAE